MTPAEPGKVHNGDTALALFDNFEDLEGAIDPVENKRLVRKIDVMISPFLSVCYAFYYVSNYYLYPRHISQHSWKNLSAN